MSEYKTSNLYEASYLSCLGFHFKAKHRSERKVVLVYPDTPDLQDAIVSFYAGGKVSAKAFCDSYRTLKDFVFADRG